MDDLGTDEIPTKRLKILRWDPLQLVPTSTIFLIGRRGTGKSTLLRDIAYNLHLSGKIDIAIGMSPTEDSTESLGTFIPKSLIYTGYCERKLQQIMDTQSLMWKRGRGYQIALFLDDCIYDRSILKTKTFRELMMNGRHRRITLILAAQYCMDLPPSTRTNIDVVIMARDNIVSNKKKLYEQFCGFFQTQNDFNKTFTATTNNFEVMVVDNKTSQSNDLSDCVRWYKARNDLPPFQLGREWVKGLNERYYVDRDPVQQHEVVGADAPIGLVVKGDTSGTTVINTSYHKS